jgi:hypothetical protein
MAAEAIIEHIIYPSQTTQSSIKFIFGKAGRAIAQGFGIKAGSLVAALDIHDVVSLKQSTGRCYTALKSISSKQ